MLMPMPSEWKEFFPGSDEHRGDVVEALLGVVDPEASVSAGFRVFYMNSTTVL